MLIAIVIVITFYSASCLGHTVKGLFCLTIYVCFTQGGSFALSLLEAVSAQNDWGGQTQ